MKLPTNQQDKRIFRRILICCRGEIAQRIIRTCRLLSIETVVVHYREDEAAPFVRNADRAYVLKGPLNDISETINQILAIAQLTHADALAPGYGPLSENADFAEACHGAGFGFIGPNVEAIRLMGNKAKAREMLAQHNVPIIMGGTKPVTGLEETLRLAEQIGYPVALKAVLGGGGRGIRIVTSDDQLPDAFRQVRDEAAVAFGDEAIYVEKFLTGVRHVEVQVLGDRYGNIIHLGERDCSIQRKNQKIVEESPSPSVNNDLRVRLCAAAIRSASAVHYDSAGTVEFLIDENEVFYFMEMNTRIQVEHPVTEMVTGLDLVEEMIRSAEGCRLRHQQQDIRFSGHAIEFRICSEDPSNDFLPNFNTVTTYRVPEGSGIRVDSGIEQGTMQSPLFDNLCAKLIVLGRDRPEALARADQALEEFRIMGPQTNLSFHQWLIDNDNFKIGDYDLTFINAHFHPDKQTKDDALDVILVGALISHLRLKSKDNEPKNNEVSCGGLAPWKLVNERLLNSYR